MMPDWNSVTFLVNPFGFAVVVFLIICSLFGYVSFIFFPLEIYFDSAYSSNDWSSTVIIVTDRKTLYTCLTFWYYIMIA